MPSTYTNNNGIELIATGEQSGTWGDTTNTNLSLIDTSLDGQVTITLAGTGTSGSPNDLPIDEGAASNGRNRLIIFNDGGDLGGTAYVQLTPNDAEKIVYIRNSLSGSRSILVFQGTYNASNDYEVPAGKTAVIYFDGAGSGAVAANVFNNAHIDALNVAGATALGTTVTIGTSLNIASSTTVDGVLDEDTMSSDSATKLATQQSIKAYVDSQVTAQDLDFAGGTGTGAVDLDSQTFTIAGTTNEIETSAASQTLTIGLPSDVTIGNDLTVTNQLTAATADINGGTIDGVTIGGSSAGAGTFTTLTANTSITGTLATAAQPNITSVGTLTALTGGTGDLNWDSGTLFVDSSANSVGIGTTSVRTGYKLDVQEATENGVNIQAGNAAADIALSVGSPSTADKFVVTSGGDVGIGTTSPDISGFSKALTIDSADSGIELASSGTIQGMFAANTQGAAIHGVGSSGIRMFTSASGSTSERMRIDSSGNVGIGTTSFSRDITLSKTKSGSEVRIACENSSNTANSSAVVSTLVGGASAGDCFFGMGVAGVVNWSIGVDNSDSDKLKLSKNFGPGANDYLTIDTSGNVGIGTSSPDYLLTMQDDSTVDGSLLTFKNQYRVSTTTADTIGGIAFSAWRDVSNSASYCAAIYAKNTGYPGTSGNIVFATRTNGGTDAYDIPERMRIDSSGNVGIGTSSPSNSLHVASADATVAHFQHTDGINSNIRISDTSDSFYLVSRDGIGSIGGVNSSSASNLNIDLTSGNVGIGTTSPSTALDVNGVINVRTSGFEFGRITTNNVDTSNGGLTFQTISSGTFSERMVIDSSGNVGIGESSPHSFGVNQSGLTISDGTGGCIRLKNDAGSVNFDIENGGGAGINLNSVNAFPLKFSTSNTERMRINSSGELCVGMTSGSNFAGAVSAKGFGSRSGYSGSQISNVFNIAWTGSANLWIDSTNLGAISISSDYRIKRNVETQTTTALDRIQQIRPVTYQRADYGTLFQEDDLIREGFIAHELQEVIPSAVEGEKDADDQVQSLKLDALCSVMVKAIQELKTENDELKARITTLENA